MLPYLPPKKMATISEVPSFDTSDTLVFSDPSNHRNTKVQMIATAIALPFFGGLTYVGYSNGLILWTFIMGSLVAVAAVGWLRALHWIIHPYRFNVEFSPNGLRLWNSKNLDRQINYERREIARILIDEAFVTFSIKSSRIEKGFPGIRWTYKRVELLEAFLVRNWPDVRVDRV